MMTRSSDLDFSLTGFPLPPSFSQELQHRRSLRRLLPQPMTPVLAPIKDADLDLAGEGLSFLTLGSEEPKAREGEVSDDADRPSSDGQRHRQNVASVVQSLTWIEQFITSKGNEYFCEIDEDYLTDRFNLTGLNAEIDHYQYALDLVTDVFDLDCSDEMREQIEVSARKLYGLVHARYITTTRGLSKMLEKFKKGDFGRCPRVFCNGTHMLPCGLSDNYGVQKVKLYCGACEDTYSPKSSKHSYIDGAYFGTTFHNMLFQVYPGYLPQKSIARYEPRVFGFKVHAAAALQRWQDNHRHQMVSRLRELGEPNPFIDDEEHDDGMEVNEGEEDEAQEL